MLNPQASLNIQLARTLWFNTYRGRVTDEAGNYLATLRIIPAMPLDSFDVPLDAPEVDPHIIVLVEEGAFEADEIIQFETEISNQLLYQLSQPEFTPQYCLFAYPSPICSAANLPATQ